MLIDTICSTCGKSIKVELSEIKRGNGKFCSTSCSSVHFHRSKTKPMPNCHCAFCGSNFYKTPSKLKNSKSGLHFCCREHKDLAQRIGGIKEIQPSHYGTDLASYRTLAFRSLIHRCNRCSYDRYPQILEVHHKDCDRTNNTLANLELLCPTCHDEQHFLCKTGKWTSKS